jgi:hypothetical protein
MGGLFSGIVSIRSACYNIMLWEEIIEISPVPQLVIKARWISI